MNFYRRWRDKQAKAAQEAIEESNKIRQQLIEKFGSRVQMRSNVNQVDPREDLLLDLKNNQIINDTTGRQILNIRRYKYEHDSYRIETDIWCLSLSPVRAGSGVSNYGYSHNLRGMYFDTRVYSGFFIKSSDASDLK